MKIRSTSSCFMSGPKPKLCIGLRVPKRIPLVVASPLNDYSIRTMRQKLTIKNRIKGVRAALASPRTPQHLKTALAVHLDELQGRLVRTKPIRSNESAQSSLLDWLRL